MLIATMHFDDDDRAIRPGRSARLERAEEMQRTQRRRRSVIARLARLRQSNVDIDRKGNNR